MGNHNRKNSHQNKNNSNYDLKTGHFPLMQENYCKCKTFCRMILHWVVHDNAGVSRPMWESWRVCVFWIIYSTLII